MIECAFYPFSLSRSASDTNSSRFEGEEEIELFVDSRRGKEKGEEV